jgi:hypothetical protein
MKNKELLIEVSTTSLSPFMKDLRRIHIAFSFHNRNEEESLHSYTNKYPGNYVLEEYVDSKLLKVLYRLKFNTPADKTVFLLRYD